jgi:transcription elongation factor GreA
MGCQRSVSELADDEIILTPEGRDRIKRELHQLTAVERPEVRTRLSEAKQSAEDFDTSEYENAKMDQAILESRIAELESIIRRARILSMDEIPTDEVGLGSVVKLKDLDSDESWEFRLVGSYEADPEEGRISIESPLGSSLVGHKLRQNLEVKTPGGVRHYRVLRIGK